MGSNEPCHGLFIGAEFIDVHNPMTDDGMREVFFREAGNVQYLYFRFEIVTREGRKQDTKSKY